MARRRVLVLGTGFGAVQTVRPLAGDERYEVTVVSPRNYFLFTPLLTGTTVGTVEFRSVIEPIRSIRGIRYLAACAGAIDPAARSVRCRQVADGREFDLAYDDLVIAVGAVSATFGIPGVREHAIFLRDLADARRVRQALIAALERASVPGLDEETRDRLLTFVVVGGGPTGVELAAELHDFVADDLPRWFPEVAGRVRIVLLEATGQILSGFGEKLRDFARGRFAREGIELRTHATVSEITVETIHLSDGVPLPYGLAVWAAGIAPTALVEGLDWPKNSRGQLLVDECLRIEGHETIWALGDCAARRDQPLPATAQVAQQQGKYLGRAIRARDAGRDPGPFRFRYLGTLAYVGEQRAVADLPHWEGRGWLMWLFWRSVYWTKLVSARNKFLVVVDWLKTALFGRDPASF